MSSIVSLGSHAVHNSRIYCSKNDILPHCTYKEFVEYLQDLGIYDKRIPGCDGVLYSRFTTREIPNMQRWFFRLRWMLKDGRELKVKFFPYSSQISFHLRHPNGKEIKKSVFYQLILKSIRIIFENLLKDHNIQAEDFSRC